MSALAKRGLVTLDKCIAAYCDTAEEANVLRDAYSSFMEGVDVVYPDGPLYEIALIGKALAVDHGAPLSLEHGA